MKTLEFPIEGVVVLHVRRGDVVVRGQPDRTTGQLMPKSAIGQNPPALQDGGTHLQVSDDLTVNLPAGTPVQLAGNAHDVVLRTLGDVSLDSCQGDLVASELTSFQAHGDMHGAVALRAVTGPVGLSTVHGDLAVANVAVVQADTIGGDVSLNVTGEVGIGKIQGDLAVNQAAGVQVREVSGDVSISNISGAIELKRVEGDLSITTPGPTVAAADVRGDVRLSGRLQPNGKYWINAAGDVVVKMSGDARIVVHARGQVHAVPDLLVESQSPGVLVALAGSSEQAADLNIEAGGDVVLTSLGQGPRMRMDAMTADLHKTLAQAQSDGQRSLVQAQGDGGEYSGSQAMQVPALTNQPRVPRPEGVGASLRSLLRDLLDSLDPQTKPAAAPTARKAAQDEVRTVLDMLAAGGVSAEEAEKLIEALRP